MLEFPNKKLSSSIILSSVCLIVHRYSPFISYTVSSRLNCSYVWVKLRHCLFLISMSPLSSAIIFIYSLLLRHCINLPFDSIIPVLLLLSKNAWKLKVSRSLLCSIMNLSCLALKNKKNAEVFIPVSAYATRNQIAVCINVPMAIQNTTARFVLLMNKWTLLSPVFIFRI